MFGLPWLSCLGWGDLSVKIKKITIVRRESLLSSHIRRFGPVYYAPRVLLSDGRTSWPLGDELGAFEFATRAECKAAFKRIERFYAEE